MCNESSQRQRYNGYWQGYNEGYKMGQESIKEADIVYEERLKVSLGEWKKMMDVLNNMEKRCTGIQGEYGLSLVSGWICPRCKQVNSPLVAHCDCKDED